MADILIKDLRFQEMLGYAKERGLEIGRWPKKDKLIELMHSAGIYSVTGPEQLVVDEPSVQPDQAPKEATRETREVDDINKTTNKRITEEDLATRRKRTDMSGGDLQLYVDESRKDPDFHYAFVNDEGGRIAMKEGRDYEKVEKPGGGYDVRPVGTRKEGGRLDAYLMRIRKEFHDDDYRQKQSKIDLTEEAIRRGEDKQGKVDVDGRYIPDHYDQGIRIKTEQR